MVAELAAPKLNGLVVVAAAFPKPLNAFGVACVLPKGAGGLVAGVAGLPNVNGEEFVTEAGVVDWAPPKLNENADLLGAPESAVVVGVD